MSGLAIAVGPGFQNMRLISNTQLTGSYGTVVAGQEFECEESTARELLTAGIVRKAGPPAVRYETKVIVPEAPEVSARHSFRDVPVPDEESEELASEGNRLLPAADAPERGTADSGGRGGRSRSAARR